MSIQMDRNGAGCSLETEEEAQDRLRRSPYGDIRRLSCHYEGSVLYLRGWLANFHHKQLAQEAVGGINGVTRIVNETEVVASSRDG